MMLNIWRFRRFNCFFLTTSFKNSVKLLLLYLNFLIDIQVTTVGSCQHNEERPVLTYILLYGSFREWLQKLMENLITTVKIIQPRGSLVIPITAKCNKTFLPMQNSDLLVNR